MRRGLILERAVFLAPAANPGNYTRQFADVLGLPDHVIEKMKRRFERRFGFRWGEFAVPDAVTGFTAPLLVFHDREDREVPWSDGDAIAKAWPGARLVTTTGLGHTRIVQDPSVIDTALEFLWARPVAAGARG
jgi:pimeloyl-ACP methyl ester carboxylesterase